MFNSTCFHSLVISSFYTLIFQLILRHYKYVSYHQFLFGHNTQIFHSFSFPNCWKNISNLNHCFPIKIFTHTHKRKGLYKIITRLNFLYKFFLLARLYTVFSSKKIWFMNKSLSKNKRERKENFNKEFNRSTLSLNLGKTPHLDEVKLVKQEKKETLT